MTEQNKQKGLEWQEKPLSDNERLKTDSNFLRGTILDDLEDSLTGGFRGDNFQLIRFHGMYEQDDRDIRAERAEEKLEPLKFMLLRCLSNHSNGLNWINSPVNIVIIVRFV